MKGGLLALFVGLGSAFGQYNVDYKMGTYQDDQTVESTVEIGHGHLITVGTLTVNEFGSTHTDMVLTRTNDDGKVVWNYRFGDKDYNEDGNGITLSWDKKHVIVVGSVNKVGGILNPRDAIVLKIRITDGAVIWATTHGLESYDEEGLLIQRTNDGIIGDQTYVIVGTAKGDPSQSFERMYAFKVKDNSGAEVWNKRYLLTDNFPIFAVRPTSMVQDGFGQLLIAGIRREINRPTKLFTVGIGTVGGAVTKDLLHYDVSNVYHVSNVSVAKHPFGDGYGLAFTADNFNGLCLLPADGAIAPDADRIGIMRLDDSRKVKWGNVYWKRFTSNNSGLSLDIEDEEFKVCVNISRGAFNTPGILRVKETNGWVVACNTFHIPSSFTDFGPTGNDMIATGAGGYFVKSIYADYGFAMANTNALADTKCDTEVKILRCPVTADVREEKSEAKDYGKEDERHVPINKVDYSERPCVSIIGGRAPEDVEDTGVDTRTSLVNSITTVIYPSPVGENQEIVNLKFTTELNDVQGTIQIMNSMGQIVLNHNLMLNKGENKVAFDATQFSSGIYMVIITADDQMLDRVKFIKN